MSDCRIRKALIGLVPIAFWRDALLARHALGCGRCREGLADIREARFATWAKEDFEGRIDFWPRFQEAFRRPETRPARPFTVRWRWGAASLAAAGLAVAGLLLLDFDGKNAEGLPPGMKFVIKSSMIYNEPAQAYIFQTQDDQTTFAWVEKQSEGEQP